MCAPHSLGMGNIKILEIWKWGNRNREAGKLYQPAYLLGGNVFFAFSAAHLGLSRAQWPVFWAIVYA